MDSNHDKVIQSHLVNDGYVIVATFSGFRAASLPVCPHRSVVVTTHRSETASFRVGNVRGSSRGKERAHQEDVDSDYLFGNFLQRARRINFVSCKMR
jgi:hypothetical protein